MGRILAVLALAAALGCEPTVALEEALSPDQAADRLKASTLAFDRAVDASNLTLAFDSARLTLSSGVLIPVQLADTPTPLEWLFVGRARLTGDAPDSVEADQLEYFTGSRKIAAEVHRAAIVSGNRWEGAAPSERTAVEVDAATRQTAGAFFREWVEDAEREGFGARTALIRALLEDPVGLAFAGVWMESPELGRVYYAVDPASKESTHFGSFRLYVLRDFLTKRERKEDDHFQRRQASERLGDPDDESGQTECGRRDGRFPPGWDAEYTRFVHGEGSLPWIKWWMDGSPAGVDAQAEPRGFEPEHYRIELTLQGEELEARGVARIRMSANAAALRVVPLDLARGIDVCEVEDGEGRSLPFHERGEQVLVALSEPAVAGEPIDLVVRFAGQPVMTWHGRRGLRDTIDWHPHVGRLDRATYDVTLRWPARLSLLASGKQVEGGKEGEQRWARRVLDLPSMGFSFEIDDYDVVEDHVGHLDLTFGFYRPDPKMTDERRAEIATTVKASLLFFETHLGLLPIDRLTVVVTDRGFSQGLLGFLTLTEGALHAAPIALSDNRSGREVRLETIAHEVAHQWWGHMVGWDSYRDQWLSEALATFSSVKFMTKITERPDDYLKRRAERLRSVLSRQTVGGQSIGAVGSVLLGWRIRANFGAGAYHAVIYDRGSAVFGTLAQQLGEEPTWKMLGTLASAVNNRVIGTGTFFRALAKMSGKDLDSFVERYVRGSGMPAVFYEYTPREEGGSWVIEGAVRQLPPARFRFAIVTVGNGWDVSRRYDREPDVSGWDVVLPFFVDTSQDGRPAGIRGDLRIQGARSEFTIPVPGRPRKLALDPQGLVLAESYGTEAGSADLLYRLGDHLLRLGRYDESAELLQRALAASASQPGAEQLVARIRLARVRLYLDRGALPAANDELRAIDKLLGPESDFYLGERTLLASRLDVRRERYDAAAIALRGFLTRLSLELDMVDADALLDPESATPLRFARGELLALLAIAEYGRNGQDADLLIRRADLAGVDARMFSVH
jgi:hypothetical protein